MGTVVQTDLPLLFAKLGLPSLALFGVILLALLFSSYVKIATVLSIVRAGFGVDGMPAALLTGGVALALSFFVMFPTIRDAATAMDKAVPPGSVSDTDRARALSAGIETWRKFVEHVTPESEQERFHALSMKLGGEEGDTKTWRVLAPAFVVSELQRGFHTGLVLFLPFLVVDLLVVTLVSAVGMQGLNPHLVSFPLKLLLFVALDGWSLIVTNLLQTYA